MSDEIAKCSALSFLESISKLQLENIGASACFPLIKPPFILHVREQHDAPSQPLSERPANLCEG